MIKWLQEKRVTDISKLQQLKERFLTGVELSTYAESQCSILKTIYQGGRASRRKGARFARTYSLMKAMTEEYLPTKMDALRVERVRASRALISW